MFRQVLSTTPLYNYIANDYFANIKGDAFQGDYSFISTVRALVAPRMADNEKIRIFFARSNYSEATIDKYSIREQIEGVNVYIDKLEAGDGVIYNIIDDRDNRMILKLKKDFTEEYHDWKIVNKVEGFFHKTFSTVCFINPEKRNFIVFVDNMDIRKYHYLQCGILAFIPWYFDPKKGISEEEMDLIKSLRETTSEMYEKIIADFANKLNFRELKIKKLLCGFETKYERREIDRAKQELDRVIARINDYNQAIGNFLREKRNYEIKILGLQTKIAEESDSSEIMEYFLCNKNIILETVSDTTMRFCCKGYVSFYDEDEAENAINNPNSYVYRPNGRPCNNIIPADDMKALMTAIFLDKTLKIKFCSCYTFELVGNVRAESNYCYNIAEFGDCTPNTHIDRYACMGNYQRVINELLQQNNYIGAIEQCVASTVSLNFSDSCVMAEFMRRMYGISDYDVNIQCIELPDGRIVKPKDAIEYLKSKNQEDDTNG